VFFVGLGLALVSAVLVNWAYAKEHDAATALPRLSLRAPVATVRTLLGTPAWLFAFGVESVGWLIYVVALHLSALALVQAVSASGIAVLAFVSSRGRIHLLPWRHRASVAIAFAGLVMLSLSLTGVHQSDTAPNAIGPIMWLASCAGAAVLCMTVVRVGIPAARWGFAAGLFFAGGDISAKLVGYQGVWFAAVVPLVALYGLGTTTLQGAFQRGGALTAAGIAELTTNAVPIAAGFVLFGEELPGGAEGPLQVAAFASLVVSATLLARNR
jgi:hypothetical protein